MSSVEKFLLSLLLIMQGISMKLVQKKHEVLATPLLPREWEVRVNWSKALDGTNGRVSAERLWRRRVVASARCDVTSWKNFFTLHLKGYCSQGENH
ncbi:MAG: hypothetical protein GY820_04735 [Gammaproteobacteria bacterium]|nr:hypothetical protein [Gammaproteobacteria bacterium]